ncbi:MAG TPA: hypothetical protein VFL97_09010 [Nitrococcus sp.]|nr:hypothetical protein [Nitrococcus sp.]
MGASHSTKVKGMPGPERDARDEELARLYRELEKAQLRMEEVASYYRSELEAVRRRAEEEAVRIQAAEVGRRKRAEEQVVYLKAEYKAVRAEADHALRRYHELQQSLDALEQHNAEQTRAEAEADRGREAATITWKTAEEEVKRLEEELCDLGRQLEREREERRQLECNHQQQENASQLAEQKRHQLIGRLKNALKLSEERRRRAEAGQSGLLPPDSPPNSWSLASPVDTTNEVDPAGGWGKLPLATQEDIADEFLRVAEDRSLDGYFDHSPEPGTDSVSDSEAETLMMELAVAEKVEQRHAAFAAQQRPFSPPSATVRIPARDPSPVLPWKWLAPIGIVAALAVAAAILLL